MPSYAPTLTAIYEEILNLRCAIPFCHLGISGSPPIFSDKEAAYHALVNAPASGTKCADAGPDEGGTGLVLVVPGDPDASLLYRKIETPSPSDLCGDPMPGGGSKPLDSNEVQQIREWIAQGAIDN